MTWGEPQTIDALAALPAPAPSPSHATGKRWTALTLADFTALTKEVWGQSWPAMHTPQPVVTESNSALILQLTVPGAGGTPPRLTPLAVVVYSIRRNNCPLFVYAGCAVRDRGTPLLIGRWRPKGIHLRTYGTDYRPVLEDARSWWGLKAEKLARAVESLKRPVGDAVAWDVITEAQRRRWFRAEVMATISADWHDSKERSALYLYDLVGAPVLHGTPVKRPQRLLDLYALISRDGRINKD